MFDGVDQIRTGRPVLGDRRPKHLEGWLANRVGHQPLNQANSGSGVFARQGQIPSHHRFAMQQLHRRRQVVGQIRQPPVVDVVGYLLEPLHQVTQCQATSRAHLRQHGILDACLRRRHGVELVQEPIDGGGLPRGIGDMLAHQFACPLHGFIPEVLSKLSDKLSTQQLDLLGALHFDAFDFGVGLVAQLFGNAPGVGAGLVDDALCLSLGLLDRVGMRPAGFLQPLCRFRCLVQFLLDSLLSVRHQPAHGRHDVAP